MKLLNTQNKVYNILESFNIHGNTEEHLELAGKYNFRFNVRALHLQSAKVYIFTDEIETNEREKLHQNSEYVLVCVCVQPSGINQTGTLMILFHFFVEKKNFSALSCCLSYI